MKNFHRWAIVTKNGQYVGQHSQLVGYAGDARKFHYKKDALAVARRLGYHVVRIYYDIGGQ